MTRPRSASIDLGAMHRQPPARGIEALAESFKIVNPHGPYNPQNNCKECAIETAQALTQGRPPITAGTGRDDVADAGKDCVATFEPGEGRRRAMWDWLWNSPPGRVYGVDAGDHAYNFVRDHDGRLYLIDGNQHLFRELRAKEDARAIVHNDDIHDEPFYLDYLDPEMGDQDDADVYDFGILSTEWYAVLRRH